MKERERGREREGEGGREIEGKEREESDRRLRARTPNLKSNTLREKSPLIVVMAGQLYLVSHL